MQKNIFIILLIVISFNGFSRTTIPINRNGTKQKSDTIIVQLDTAKKVLFINRKDALLPIKEQRVKKDSSGLFLLLNNAKSILEAINVYADSSSFIDSVQFVTDYNLLKSKDDSILYIFHPKELPTPTPIPKTYFFELIIAAFAVLILAILSCVLFLKLNRRKSNVHDSLNSENDINNKNIFDDLKKQFHKELKSKNLINESSEVVIGYISDSYHKRKQDYDNLNTDYQLIEKVSKERFELINKIEKELKVLKSELSNIKRINDEDRNREIGALEAKMRKMEEEYQEKANVYKGYIIDISKKMILRYKDFSEKYKGKFDEDEAKREIIQFNIAFSQLAYDVFAVFSESATEEAKLNLSLLQGQNVSPKKIVDQYSEIGSVTNMVSLIIKVLEDNHIKGIDKVYFNGSKIELK